MAQLTSAFFQTILAIEGGFQDFPTDSGNYCGGVLIGTKYGMSAVAVSAWLGRCPSATEMRNLTEQDARNFYAWYFDLYGLFQIENQQFFELLANNTMGSPANAAKVEQRVLNQFGYQVAVDGKRGPQTIQALNKAWRDHGAKFYNAIREAWVQYLVSLNRPEFITGWLTRMDRYFPPIATTGISLGLALLALYVGFKITKKAA